MFHSLGPIVQQCVMTLWKPWLCSSKKLKLHIVEGVDLMLVYGDPEYGKEKMLKTVVIMYCEKHKKGCRFV